MMAEKIAGEVINQESDVNAVATQEAAEDHGTKSTQDSAGGALEVGRWRQRGHRVICC
jgi:hypothetical protein